MSKYDRLFNNICDVIKEEQIKLGFMREKVRLYYPLKSLEVYLGVSCDIGQMCKELVGFSKEAFDRLGEVNISNNGERFCLEISQKGVEYIHENVENPAFLMELIELVGRHGNSIDDVIALFEKYSDSVCVEKMENGEFDYLLYFQDGRPDAYRYCMTNEMGHWTYHRFEAEDYKELL